MCGVFGWAGNGRCQPTADELGQAASGAAARGPHGHGWAAVHGSALTVHRALGTLTPASVPTTTHRLIGHSRLATSGDPNDLEATHPILRGGHAIVHNGTAEEALPLAPGEVSDSAALATLYARFRADGESPVVALTRVLEVARSDAWAVLVLDRCGDILASAQGLPLWCRTQPTGYLLSSRQLDGARQLGDAVRTVNRPEEVRVA